MLSFQSQVDTLYRTTRDLLNMGFDGTPLYSNEFCALNTEVYRQQLPVSLLKCQLLVACYSEVFDEDLAQEAHAIMNSRTGREWTKAECEVSDYLDSLETNPWPDWEIVE